MFKFKFWMFIIVLLLIPASFISAQDSYVSTVDTIEKDESKTADSSFVIRVTDNLLTVKVKDIPLKRIMKELTIQIPVKISLFVSEEELIMADFSGLPIEKGLKRLLKGFNYAFVYDTEEDKSNLSGIRKVVILSKTGGNRNVNTEPIIIPDNKEKPSLESLSIALNDENIDVREEALYSLAELNDERSIDILAKVLLNDKDEDIRMSAVDALEIIGSEGAIEPLKEALKDKDIDVRISAADALASIGDEATIDSLIVALQDKDAEVRASAVEAIGSIGGVRAIQALQGSLSDEDEEVSEIAAEELERLK